MGDKIAFLGLGIMGGSMAANLAQAGFDVSGWNRTPGKPQAKRAADAGVRLVESAPEAVVGAKAVFLCLTDAADIEAVLLKQGIADATAGGALVVDMSTTGPASARLLHERLSARGLHFLDAPVSGGDVGAREGTLTIMVGGEEADFQTALPYFKAMGKNIRYCGPSGSGQAVKLCNQILCAVNMIAVCEAFELAEHLGVSPQLVVDVCSTGAAGSWALSNLGPRIARGDFAPGFKIKDMQKDLRHAAESVENIQGDLPGTALAQQLFEQAKNLGGADGAQQGTQAMMRAYEAPG